MFEFTTSRHQARFIEDVAPPASSPYFNVRNDRVRRHSIGHLDAQYTRLRRTSQVEKSVDIVKAFSQKPATPYTRIPPLAALWTERSSSQLKSESASFESLLKAVGVGISAAAITIGSTLRALPWLPKKYALNKGVYTDLNTRTFNQARWSLPFLLISGGILLASLPWSGPTITPGAKVNHPQTSSTVQAQLVNAKLVDSATKPTPSSHSDTPQRGTAAGVAPVATSSIEPLVLPTSPIGGSGGMGGGTPIVDTPPAVIPPEISNPPSTEPDILPPIIPPLNDPLAPVFSITDSLL